MADLMYFAQKAFILHDGKLLAIQKAETCPYHPGCWEVPGGRMDLDENVDQHIKREVMEEVGIEINPGELFYLWDWRIQVDGQLPKVVAAARFAEPLTFDIDMSGQEELEHIGKAEWLPIDDLLSYKWIPNFTPAIEEFLKRYASRKAA